MKLIDLANYKTKSDNKNYKIISQILSTGNYKQIFDYNFQKNMYLKDIKSFYINNSDFHNIYSVVKKIFQSYNQTR